MLSLKFFRMDYLASLLTQCCGQVNANRRLNEMSGRAQVYDHYCVGTRRHRFERRECSGPICVRHGDAANLREDSRRSRRERRVCM